MALADLVDEIVDFEAMHTFAVAKTARMRSHSDDPSCLSSEFIDTRAWLHALRQSHQSLKRLHFDGSAAIKQYLGELAVLTM